MIERLVLVDESGARVASRQLAAAADRARAAATEDLAG